MIRNYNFEWFENKDNKYGTARHRFNTIRLSAPSGKTSIDAKIALNIFINSFGNLKKNTIVRIKEMDEHGQIGEDIIPSENSSIVPSER